MGDFRCICDYCGVEWHRSQLVRDQSGLLACPDDQPGLDMVALAEGNAAGALEPISPQNVRDGGSIDVADNPNPVNPNPPPVPRPW